VSGLEEAARHLAEKPDGETGGEAAEPSNHPLQRISRRYYPFAIGALFLGLVVGLFPSTTPTGLLGFIPQIKVIHEAAPPLAVPALKNASPSFAPPVGFADDFTPPVLPQVSPPSGTPAASVTTAPPATGGLPGAGQTVSCSLPVPSEPPAPPAAELIEAFEVAGPFGPAATAGDGLIAPVVPIVAPLFPLSAALIGGSGGAAESTALSDIGELEGTLTAPFASEIDASNQESIAFDEELERDAAPLLTLAEEIPDLDCVGELEIAAGATLAPSAYPGATPLVPVGSASPSERPAFVVLSTSWAQGLSPTLEKAVQGWAAAGVPVEMRLGDDAPATTDPTAPTFAAFVASTIAKLPTVGAFEIDPFEAASAPSGSRPPTDQLSSLAGAVQAAAVARGIGQLLGVGLPVPLSSATWWSSLGKAIGAPALSRVNFAGLDAGALGTAETPSDLRWIIGLLRQSGLAAGGLSADLPLFVTVGPTAPLSNGAEVALARQYAASLQGLGVGLLAWSSPGTVSGAELPDTAAGQSLLGALTR
jgi:hypothetical protein